MILFISPLRKNLKKLFFFSILVGLVSCQGSGGSSVSPGNNEDQQVKPKPTAPSASGAIFGKPWQYLSGRADYVSSSSSSKKFWVISLFSTRFSNPCTEISGSDQQIQLQVRSIGSWPIDPDDGPFVKLPSVIFMDFNRQNILANNGVITIALKDQKLLSGTVYASFSPTTLGETKVTGSFEVPVCNKDLP